MKQKKWLLQMKRIVVLSFFVLVGVSYLFYDVLRQEAPVSEPEAVQKLALRFGYNIPKESVLHQAAVLFAQKVKEKTNGDVIIELYPNQVLGNDHQMVEMARLGELDMILTPTAKMSVASPSMQYADLPFYFPDREDVYELLDGEVGRMLLEKLSDIDLVGVTIWDNGFKHFTANTPLLTPEDFAGKKFRVMKSRIIMEQFKLLGATPVAIDFHETRAALKDHAVDGQENPLVAIYTMDFHSVQNNLTLSEHAYLGYVLSISSKVYKQLPMHIRDVLVQSALEVTPWEREQTRLKDAEFLEKIKKSGIHVDSLDTMQKVRFKTFMENIPRKFESLIGSDIISKSQDLLYQKYNDEANEVVLGFDSDLSAEVAKGGLALKRGAELAIDEINAEGGLLGKKVVLIAKDNRAVASKGVENVKELLEHKNLIGLIGGIHSAIVFEEMKLLEDSLLPVLLGWSANAGLTDLKNNNDNVFRISANDQLASEFLVENALKRGKSFSILYENSVWGRDNYISMQEILAKKGLEFAFASPFNRGQREFTQEIENVITKGSDVLLMIANPKESVSIVLELAKHDTPPLVVSHWGVTGGDFFMQAKEALQKVDLIFFQTYVMCSDTHEKAKKVMRKYEEMYEHFDEEEKTLAFAVLQMYDAVKLFAEAVRTAQSFEYVKVREALEQIDTYDGAMKRYTKPFAGKMHEGLQKEDYQMAKFNDKGKVILLRKEKE